MSFSLKEPGVYALLGTNGAGKTTLVKLLMRLYDVKAGAIEADGRDIRDYKVNSYRNSIGTVFQDFNIFGFTLKENVACSSNNIDEERVIKHYLSDEKGMPVGDYLLYLEGYITECPTNKIIKSNLSKGNKNIGNVQVLESNSWFDKVSHGYHLNLAMELIDSGGPKDAEKIPCYLERLNKLLSNYNNDETFLIRVKDIYNASSYLELAKILDSMNISNNAIGIYGIKVHMHS